MTVCVALKVHDCIVFAADSAVTLSDERGGVVNVWEHGSKVFNLHRELPVVATTAGMANFGSVSVNNLAKDLRLQLHNKIKPRDGGKYTIEQIVDEAESFFQQKYQAIASTINGSHSFSFFVGGYGSDSGDKQGEIWKLLILDGIFTKKRLSGENDEHAIYWDGQHEALDRLLFGFDRVKSELLFRKWGWNQEDIDRIIFDMIKRMGSLLVHPSMPVQDAIKLADFLVNTAKGYSAFLLGANIVGGETDIATVTKHEKFKWIKRKHYYPAHLNRGGIDHVQ